MSAATMAGGLDPSTPLRAIPAALGFATPAESATEVSRTVLEKPRARVAINSETTHTYDAQGNFPTLRLFQIARQLPEYRPFGSLVVEPGPRGRAALVARTYGRQEYDKPRFIDHTL